MFGEPQTDFVTLRSMFVAFRIAPQREKPDLDELKHAPRTLRRALRDDEAAPRPLRTDFRRL